MLARLVVVEVQCCDAPNALDGSQALKNRPHGHLSTLKNCIWLVFKGKIRLKCCFCKHFFFGSFSLLLCTLHF